MKTCKHQYKFINDGDQGSHYLCKKCKHKEYDWRKVMYNIREKNDET